MLLHGQLDFFKSRVAYTAVEQHANPLPADPLMEDLCNDGPLNVPGLPVLTMPHMVVVMPILHQAAEVEKLQSHVGFPPCYARLHEIGLYNQKMPFEPCYLQKVDDNINSLTPP